MKADIVKIQVGKQGLSEQLVKDIVAHIKKKKGVQVRFLKSFIADKDRKEVARNLQATLGVKGKLVGNVLTLDNQKFK